MQSTTTMLDATSRHRQNWPPWIVVSLVSLIFALLCCLSGRRMEDYANDFDDASRSNFRPVVITSIFTGIVIFIFIVASFFITWARSTIGHGSHSLDAVFAACLLYMFLFTLLCAASLNGFRRQLEHLKDREHLEYSNTDYGVFVVTFALGYLCAIFYLLYTLLVVWSAVFFSQTPHSGLPPVKPQELTGGAPAGL